MDLAHARQGEVAPSRSKAAEMAEESRLVDRVVLAEGQLVLWISDRMGLYHSAIGLLAWYNVIDLTVGGETRVALKVQVSNRTISIQPSLTSR